MKTRTLINLHHTHCINTLIIYNKYGLLPEYLVPKHRITFHEYAGISVSREKRSLERDAEIPAYSRKVIRCFGTRYSGNDPFIIYYLMFVYIYLIKIQQNKQH